MILCAAQQHMKGSKQPQEFEIYQPWNQSGLKKKRKKEERLILLRELKWWFFLITDSKGRVIYCRDGPIMRKAKPGDGIDLQRWSAARLVGVCGLSELHWEKRMLLFSTILWDMSEPLSLGGLLNNLLAFWCTLLQLCASFLCFSVHFFQPILQLHPHCDQNRPTCQHHLIQQLHLIYC